MTQQAGNSYQPRRPRPGQSYPVRPQSAGRRNLPAEGYRGSAGSMGSAERQPRPLGAYGQAAPLAQHPQNGTFRPAATKPPAKVLYGGAAPAPRRASPLGPAGRPARPAHSAHPGRAAAPHPPAAHKARSKDANIAPDVVETALKKEKHRTRLFGAIRSTIYSLIVVAAIAILVATLWLPVLRVYGESMTPTLNNGEILFTIKGSDFERGDIVAFYYNNKILIKRVIALPGEWINIRNDGSVYINDQPLEEDYVVEKALGECDIDLPFQVPEGRIFVMGDHRSTSVDSRTVAVGCIAPEEIVGRVRVRIWPLKHFGMVR